MYDILGADLSGFVRAWGYPTPFSLSIDQSTGYGALSKSASVLPGGAPADPSPAPVCVPMSVDFRITTDGLSLNPGDSWRVFRGESYPLSEHPWKAPDGMQVVVHLEYQHGGSGTLPTSISGHITAIGLFAVYGGIQPVSTGPIGGLDFPQRPDA
jgi:hypothetical protein